VVVLRCGSETCRVVGNSIDNFGAPLCVSKDPSLPLRPRICILLEGFRLYISKLLILGCYDIIAILISIALAAQTLLLQHASKAKQTANQKVIHDINAS
jgi:hypothetical protein